jgi:hypothetical protein
MNRRDLPCPSSGHGEHGDPDNSGQCIYCGAVLDLEAGESDPPRDACEVCKGRRGGVPGNENIVNGRVMCDYCTSDALEDAKP